MSQDSRTEAALETLSEATGVPVPHLVDYMEGARNLFAVAHTLAKKGGWWNDPATGEPLERNRAELICLMHSELSEMMEGERKNLMDDKLPHRKMAEVEMADTFVRGGDYAGGFDYDPITAMVEKMAFNLERADHKAENRLAAGGKTF